MAIPMPKSVSPPRLPCDALPPIEGFLGNPSVIEPVRGFASRSWVKTYAHGVLLGLLAREESVNDDRFG